MPAPESSVEELWLGITRLYEAACGRAQTPDQQLVLENLLRETYDLWQFTLAGELLPDAKQLHPEEESVLRQLQRFAGDVGGEAILRDCKAQAKLVDITHPQQSLVVAEEMIKHGGIVAVVGRVVRRRALARGARLTD